MQQLGMQISGPISAAQMIRGEIFPDMPPRAQAIADKIDLGLAFRIVRHQGPEAVGGGLLLVRRWYNHVAFLSIRFSAHGNMEALIYLMTSWATMAPLLKDDTATCQLSTQLKRERRSTSDAQRMRWERGRFVSPHP